MGDLNYALGVDVGEPTRNAIFGLLRDYNLANNNEFFTARELPENAPRPIEITATDPDGRIAGGLVGSSQFKWMRIDILVVREDLRRMEIGQRLMTMAETEAASSGCSSVFVDTMSYQAPEFYKRLGYGQVGFIRDWDSHGHDKYFFVKQL
jgi:N-acetylglutamate synthase-like GNAT family acetyltransferase